MLELILQVGVIVNTRMCECTCDELNLEKWNYMNVRHGRIFEGGITGGEVQLQN